MHQHLKDWEWGETAVGDDFFFLAAILEWLRRLYYGDFTLATLLWRFYYGDPVVGDLTTAILQ